MGLLGEIWSSQATSIWPEIPAENMPGGTAAPGNRPGAANGRSSLRSYGELVATGSFPAPADPPQAESRTGILRCRVGLRQGWPAGTDTRWRSSDRTRLQAPSRRREGAVASIAR
jgi:hypothetical protein